MQWRQQQELAEVKHNADLLMMEFRQTVEAVKQKVLDDFKNFLLFSFNILTEFHHKQVSVVFHLG